MVPAVRPGWLELADARVYYEVIGEGPPLVFAHGLGGSHLSWWQQVPAFAGRFTCIVFAHRGFAPSRDALSRPRPDRFADDLCALLDSLGVGRVALVAQSMGGWTALEFALRAPDRVAAMVLAGSTGTFAHPSIASLMATAGDPAVLALRARGVHPAAGQRMARELPELHHLYMAIDRMSGGWDRDEVRATLDSMRVRGDAELGVLALPVLALVGEEDVLCPVGNVELFAEAAPSAELRVVARAGHSVYFERPAVFNEIVMNFLERSGACQ